MTTDFHTGITDAERERLVLLIEECGEVIHAATKILRHGYESFNPDAPELPNNREQLRKEITDLRTAMLFLWKSGDISPNNFPSDPDVARKLHYMHYQNDLKDIFYSDKDSFHIR